MDGELKGYLGNDRMYRRPIVETRYSSPMQMFDGMTYAKGGCVLHMLRGLLGDEGWWKGIRTYAARHKFQVVETDDFRKAMEEASGKDLKWFFDQWLYKAGHPELKVRWHYEDADKTVRVKVEQTQKTDEQTPLFRLPTTLEITEAVGKSRVVPIVIDGTNQEFVIPAEVKPKMVRIDPNCWLIKELDFEKTGRGEPVPASACFVRRLPSQCRPSAGQTVRNSSAGQECPGDRLEEREERLGANRDGDPDQRGRRRAGPPPQSPAGSRPPRPGEAATKHFAMPCKRPRRIPRRVFAWRPFAAWPASSTTPSPKPSSAPPGPIPRKLTEHAPPPCDSGTLEGQRCRRTARLGIEESRPANTGWLPRPSSSHLEQARPQGARADRPVRVLRSAPCTAIGGFGRPGTAGQGRSGAPGPDHPDDR